MRGQLSKPNPQPAGGVLGLPCGSPPWPLRTKHWLNATKPHRRVHATNAANRAEAHEGCKYEEDEEGSHVVES